MPGKPWSHFGAAGLTAVAVYLALPAQAQLLLYQATGLSSGLAVLVGIRLHRPARPAPWYLLAVGLLAWALGDVGFAADGRRFVEAPDSSLAHAVHVAAYPLLLLALAMMVRRRGVRDWSAWQDCGIWALGAALLCWEWLIEPNVTRSDADLPARLVAVTYPALDLVLLLFALRLVTGTVRANGVRAWLVAATGCWVVSDSLLGVQILSGTFAPGTWVDLGWMLAYVGFGVCGLHPGMEEVEARAPQGARGGLRSAGLLLAVMLAPGLLAYQSLFGDHVDGLFIAVAASLMLVLAGLRGGALVRELEATSSTLRSREGEMHRRATTDPLTGLANRALLLEHLDTALGAGVGLTVALLDLDGFKGVNDSLGHEVGDALLREVAVRLTAASEPDELVARLGGDEFAVVSTAGATSLAERLLRTLGPPTVIQGSAIRLGASVGLVASGPGSGTVTQLLRHADVAMYVAKSSGGHRCEVYDAQMSVSLLRQAAMRRKLSQGLELGEFVPYYQPVVDLRTSELVGFEALVRWCLPGVTPIGPDEWMGAAEQAGLVGVLDLQVLRQAAAQMVTWSSTEGDSGAAGGLTLAVNMSGHTLQEVDVAEQVLAVLAGTGLSPERLVLEVTEGVLIDDPAVGERLQRLRIAGVRIALDDFGTGWSSLDYLRRFPVDVLKLDRSFVAGLSSGGAGEAVPAAVVQLAATLGLHVIAEGVETLRQAERLSRLGSMHAQGYLFGQAEPAEALAELVSTGRVASVTGLSDVPVGASTVEG